jgi:hypothetical protein
MLIAFLSDIHGHLPAPEAALAGAQAGRASRILSAPEKTSMPQRLPKDFAEGNQRRFRP